MGLGCVVVREGCGSDVGGADVLGESVGDEVVELAVGELVSGDVPPPCCTPWAGCKSNAVGGVLAR